jgi:hypothetical protein
VILLGAADSTILIYNRFFEMPPHLAGRRVEVRSIRSICPEWRSTSKDNSLALPVRSMLLSMPSCLAFHGRRRLKQCRLVSTMSNCWPSPRGRMAMFETYFGFKKAPFSDEPDPKQLFEYVGWKQV